jgi:hypothetical protein
VIARHSMVGVTRRRSPEGDVDEADEDRDLDQRADPAASAWPEVAPNTPMATAMASSKLLPAAVNASVVLRS